MFITREMEAKSLSKDWTGVKVLVIGIARQGIAVTQYLSQRGAEVAVNDRRSLEQLHDARQALAGESIEWAVGGHPISILDGIDVVCVSGGVPIDNPLVQEASRRGLEITNDSQIFLEVCPCKVIGITGSAGKTTTTTLVGLIAQAAVDQLQDSTPGADLSHPGTIKIDRTTRVWVGGNIGSPLIAVVDQMQPSDIAVMELSSFQLEHMHRSPQVAALLNITPNHLDRHKTMEAYLAAKERILQFQTSQDVAVLNLSDDVVSELVHGLHGRLVSFCDQKVNIDSPIVYFDPQSQYICMDTQLPGSNNITMVIHRGEIPLRGEHNLMNVIAACAIALACGFSAEAIRSGVKDFQGIPHRLEFVRSWGGGDWYNDSIATAPERSIAAIKSFSEPLILLAGGRNKDLPWDGFAALACQRVKHLVLFGEAVGVISAALTRYEVDSEITITCCSGLEEAVKAAAARVGHGDVVLLSPGGTSFDEFQDFEERGEAFRKWVMELV